MKREDYLAILKQRLSKERYIHSLGVEETAVHLARIYNLDERKAALAGLMHDYAKDMKKEMLLKKAVEFGIVINDVEINAYQVLHGPVGAKLLQQECGIDDEEVLQAIAKHTTGGKHMTELEKIVYLADYIEPNRDLPAVDEIRRKAEFDLDEAIFLVIEQTFVHLLRKKVCIDQNTVDLWNSLVKKKGEIDS